MRILIIEGPGFYPRTYAPALAGALRRLDHRVLVRPWAGAEGFRVDPRTLIRRAVDLLGRTQPDVVHVLTGEPWVAEAFAGHGRPVVQTTEERPAAVDWVVVPSRAALSRFSSEELEGRIGALPYAFEVGSEERDPGSFALAAVDPRDVQARRWIEELARRVPYVPLYYKGDVRGARFVVSLSSQPEAWPIGAAEAMAAGRPVLTGWGGAADELVVEGVTGFLSAPGDVASLALHMDYLWDHPEEALRLGEEGREHLRDAFKPEVHALALLRWYLKAGVSRLAV